MAASIDAGSLEASAVRKVLRLLSGLRQTEAGQVIYHQVERMLDEIIASSLAVQQAYASLACVLLDAFAMHLQRGSAQLIQTRLLSARLQPPLTLSELQVMRQYVDTSREHISALTEVDQAIFVKAVEPLFRAFDIATTTAENQHETAPGNTQTSTPSADSRTAQRASSAQEKAAACAPPQRQWTRPAARSLQQHPMQGMVGQPRLRREEQAPREQSSAEREPRPPLLSVRPQFDIRRRDIQALQAGLAEQVEDTIAKNQEFGVLLEVVSSELRQVDEMAELENLRWTLIREIEKLIAGHHELADKLNSTHHQLQIIESDSRQLTDELTRVQLLSLTDELTGLPNRRAFLRRLEDEVARVQRYGFPLSLALMDLDKFKEINDKYGHAGGDEVLRVYAKNILSIFRHHDLVARYGGEEFAVLLPNTEGEGALRALGKVKNRCIETRWQTEGAVISVPNFSAGIALYKPGETSTAFIERVDKALYRAKRLGRNRIEMDLTYESESNGANHSVQQAKEPT